MTKQSITEKGSKPKECPREDKPVRGNSPDWYTREKLPYYGENFNVLTSLQPMPGVMFEDGVATNAAVSHFCIIHPPIDHFDSFYKKAADFYAEIRERNSGAANYDTLYLASYMYNVGVLHALLHAVARVIKATRSVMRSSADSPYILSALAGSYNYSRTAAKLAVLSNQYTIIAKDVENLPLPHVTAFDRSRFLYSTFFADSKNPKPSLISFVPRFVIELVPSRANQGTTLSSTATSLVSGDGSNTTSEKLYIDSVLEYVEGLLSRITTDPIYTIIRGDIRNAFGNSAYWEGLVSLINTPLQILPEDREVMSQLENLSLIPKDANTSANVEYVKEDGFYKLKLQIDGVNDSNVISRIFLDNNMVNYHGGKLKDGELLAITRMMYVAEKQNNLTNTYAAIVASSGNTVYYSSLFTSVTADRYSWEVLSDKMLDAQRSTVQSTMKSAYDILTFAASNIGHFPMVLFGDSPRSYMWNTDNFAIMSNVNLQNMTVIANRSLWDVHLPRGEHGRLEKRS